MASHSECLHHSPIHCPSGWVYGVVDYQCVWHSPYLASARSIHWHEASLSHRANSVLCLGTPDSGPSSFELSWKKKKKKKCFCHGALDLSPGPSASDICSFKQCNHPKLTEMINISLLSLRVRGTAREGRKRSKKKKGQSNIPIPSSAFKQIYCVG